ncbi:septum site-determining protein MinC [Candidatus Vallotia tarda]|uniref:Probable septum site-determining protein MinC n=1 Tax=Candidatus Vallotiella hemipterorum TaxID=1177213 RepID=A0A916NFB3_9BURK|nr:septum site-determining protein MinC [Candidatus Vallotia tarda]CAG7600808.1 Probable septum site-determining protein MinC [Candidatus Vallotia tarda]
MPAKNSLFFELRNSVVNTLLFVVKTTDLAKIQAELSRRFDMMPEFFANDLVVIDVRRLSSFPRILVIEIAEMLKTFRMHPAGVVAHEEQRLWIQLDTLPFVELRESFIARSSTSISEPLIEATSTISQVMPCNLISKPRSILQADINSSRNSEALVIERPLRSGQQVYAKGDLVVLNLVSYGAEVIAEGSIHIYAPLRGRALAGVHVNYNARIFCMCLEPELISIAGIYQTTETPLDPSVLGKSVQIRLEDEKLIIEPLRLT